VVPGRRPRRDPRRAWLRFKPSPGASSSSTR
jgi:hypothetical protein